MPHTGMTAPKGGRGPTTGPRPRYQIGAHRGGRVRRHRWRLCLRRHQLVSRVRLRHRYLRQVMKEIAVSDRRLRDQLLQVGVQVQGISLSKLGALVNANKRLNDSSLSGGITASKRGKCG